MGGRGEDPPREEALAGREGLATFACGGLAERRRYANTAEARQAGSSGDSGDSGGGPPMGAGGRPPA